MPYWIWLTCGTALLIIEILAPHLVTIWFALAALVTGVASYWIKELPHQLAFFAISSVISFSMGWFGLRKNMSMNLRPMKERDKLIVGEAGTVVSTDGESSSTGRVRFQGPVHGDEVWVFDSDDQLRPGDRCVVTEVAGSKVKVKKVSQ